MSPSTKVTERAKSDPIARHPPNPNAVEHPSNPIIAQHPSNPIAEYPSNPTIAQHPSNPIAEHPSNPIAEHPSNNPIANHPPNHLAQHPGSQLNVWPSQIASNNATWLLPPHNDQAAALAMMLRTEIQAHNIAKEMLHATEQRRLEVFNICSRLSIEVRGWEAAYNSMTEALQRCSDEFSRISAENVSLKTQLQISLRQCDLGLATSTPTNDQILDLRSKLAQQQNGYSA
ncbi:hypothetical protein BU24DRAFT_467144 [Aaosphaeria arxii CBS 175.79]|uniref:Uncharacterized protein n=1 Tax=Aaosphaeria arxii CBS 175.79 TaxID=1450172 RepID=A0A6A5XCA3_9PLEO|nr:uncharacterized protein BU24DRAFT_467144 [Aaosphaeria arxii CBS 175.79]KAF2010521.1 hypothetical protein BU24DRAFT_467144 [Aaosphaeria arxii CBS 175.79]